MYLSIIIPVYNEEDNIIPLYNEIKKTLFKLNKTYEILFVNDGSADNTFENIYQLRQKDDRVRLISFKRNFGQSAAIQAGFDNSKGDIIITMDGDMQNDSNDIYKLLEGMNKGYDVVCGWRYNRKDDFLKKFFSKISNCIRKTFLNETLHDSGCTLRAYKRETVGEIKLYGEMHRYISSLLREKGFSVGEVKVNHRDRKFGKTKYNIKRLHKGFLDLLFVVFWYKYSTKPLHFFGTLGLFSFFSGIVIVFYKVVYQLLYLHIPLDLGPLLIVSAFLLLMGLLFILFGFLAEIIIRIYYKSSQNKTYELK